MFLKLRGESYFIGRLTFNLNECLWAPVPETTGLCQFFSKVIWGTFSLAAFLFCLTRPHYAILAGLKIAS